MSEVTAKSKWYVSKTLWVNAIATAALAIQTAYGFQVSPEIQAYALVVINVILRLVTKTELTT